MLKLGHKLRSILYIIRGSLFLPSFYHRVFDYKISRFFLSFFLALLLAYSVPLLKVISIFDAIDLVNPSNRISKELDHFIEQIPNFSIKNGKIQMSDDNIVKISDYQKANIIVEFNPVSSAEKEGAVFFAADGVYIQELGVRKFLLNLFDLPINTFASGNSQEEHTYYAYNNFNDIEISADLVRQMLIGLTEQYDITSYLLVYLYLVTANLLLIVLQLIILSFFTIFMLGQNKLKYLAIYKLTIGAFIPCFILEIINIMTYKQSFILNVYPYSFVLFIIINMHFIRFAVTSVFGKVK